MIYSQMITRISHGRLINFDSEDLLCSVRPCLYDLKCSYPELKPYLMTVGCDLVILHNSTPNGISQAPIMVFDGIRLG